MILCVTGTGTDVGKTIATATLAAQARSTYARINIIKPAQTGEEAGHGDLHTISRLTGITSTYEFARYPDPLAPLMAAQHAGLAPLNFEATVQNIMDIDAEKKDSLTLIEGAGGLLVELGTTNSGEAWTLANLARALDSALCVVTTTGLGSLNHATLTLEALASRNISCAGLIGGSMSSAPDLATTLNLQEFRAGLGHSCPWLGAIPAGAGELSPAAFSQQAQEWLSFPV